MKSRRSHQSPFRKLTITGLLLSVLFAILLSSALPASTAKTNDGKESPALVFGAIYTQTNLVSDLPGVALVEDRLLKNPWGLALRATSPFWVVNHNNDRATLYRGDVSGSPLVPNLPLPVVSIPNVPTVLPAPSQPTGVVANNTTDFVVPSPFDLPAPPAQFIFCTLSGGISAWQPDFGSAAKVVQFQAGHGYTGLTIGSNASGNLLFVADVTNRKIDVFDKNFNPTSVPGNFIDATIPANFGPYNIQNLGGSLYVTYAQAAPGSNPALGFVRKFDTNGVRDPAFAIDNGLLRNPWGLAIAPASFGPFSNRLLVGSTYSLGIHEPTVNAYDAATGVLIGSMVDGSGAALEIRELFGLTFGNGTNGGDPNTLYFAAGANGNLNRGLFGSLKPVSGIPATLVKFSSDEYSTTENAGHVDITVTRSGDVSGTSTVNYATVDLVATQKSDFEIAVGRLTFNPGETSKTFRVLITDNNLWAAGTTRDLQLFLSNATGAALVSPNIAMLRIMDNEFDTPVQPENIIDVPRDFVRLQYFDFLNREPDAPGLDFWTNQITSCGTDHNCIEIRRINVSAAFFLSIEFQKTGMLAYLTERCATGTLPRYGYFMRDVQALQKNYVFGAPGASAQLEANTRAFFDEFVTRPEFVAKYGSLSNLDYVDALLASGQISATTGRVFISRLEGSQVVPPVSTAATGVAIGRSSLSNIDTLDFSLTLKNLSSSQLSAHLHAPALAGANAPVIATLPNGDFRDFTVALTAQLGADLRNGRLYIDVHTQNNPDGEIRAQLGPVRFQRDVIAGALDSGTITRAEALRLIVEDGDFRARELNSAFVLMEYFGYLQRDPDAAPNTDFSGFNFWLAKLNQAGGNYIEAEMVKAFISSDEYRARF